eukprot:jgi/Psemu1/222759/e_gw1.1249.26.1
MSSEQPEENTVWSPGLRKTMAGIASAGALETGYLTYAKLSSASGGSGVFCGNSQAAVSSCDQVLSGPYSHLPFLDNVPLAALGFLAYATVGVLALQPLVASGSTCDDDDDDIDDTTNRILLTALSTSMATFSIFLVTLLFGVLKASCPYCLASASMSFLLANVALIGGCLPEPSLVSESDVDDADADADADAKSDTTAGKTRRRWRVRQREATPVRPPAITTDSSERALALGRELTALGGARMYGAHWCSHCYDQKEILGRQVFDNNGGDSGIDVRYVECSKDGIRSQSKLCKEKEIPGYPTWEIQGKLYPGQQELDELEELVKGIKEEAAAVAATN